MFRSKSLAIGKGRSPGCFYICQDTKIGCAVASVRNKLPGDIALEGSHDLLGCAAFGSSTFDVGASLGINPHPHDDDGGQCSVQTAVTAAIEPVAHRVT